MIVFTFRWALRWAGILCFSLAVYIASVVSFAVSTVSGCLV